MEGEKRQANGNTWSRGKKGKGHTHLNVTNKSLHVSTGSHCIEKPVQGMSELKAGPGVSRGQSCNLVQGIFVKSILY